MKQLKLFLVIIIIGCLSRMLSSCCTGEQITSSRGFSFVFFDNKWIKKIELIDVNKTIDYPYNATANQAKITLNPADTISRYRIFYDDTSGVVVLGYTKKAEYGTSGCDDGLKIVYDAHVSSTTFSYVEISKNIIDENVYVKIIP